MHLKINTKDYNANDDSWLQSHEAKERDELSRTISSLHWLLLTLVLFYIIVPNNAIELAPGMILALVAYCVSIVFFRVIKPSRTQLPWKYTIEIWTMIAFITFETWCTGRTESTLLVAYLIPIVASALVFGRNVTMMQFLLISGCFLYLSFLQHSTEIFTTAFLTKFVDLIFPLAVVAYSTALLVDKFEESKRRIKRLPDTDELTGLWNMRAFSRKLENVYHQASRYGHTFTVMMIDSDNLKAINDTYGHEVGNELIYMVAQCVKRLLRSTDVVARYGGDEFVALMAETDAEGAYRLAERIRAEIETSSIIIDSEEVISTISIGIASFPENGDGLKAILMKADKAMYASKARGKNKITIYQNESTGVPETAADGSSICRLQNPKI